MTARPALAMIALLLATRFVFGQEPPDRVTYEDDPNWPIWVSADTVLTSEGAVKELEESDPYMAYLGKQLRYKLDTARELFGPDHARGLVHGTTPPLDLCVGRRSATMSFAGPETNDFEMTAMFSEVVVEGTVSGFSLGFYIGGKAGALLTLDDVKP